MTMQDYVVSRELAEKLKAAEFKQKTVWCYVPGKSFGGTTDSFVAREELFSDVGNTWTGFARDISLAAPMTDELLEQVKKFDFTIVNLNSETLSLRSDSLDDPDAAILGRNLVEVLAEFWLALQGEKTA